MRGKYFETHFFLKIKNNFDTSNSSGKIKLKKRNMITEKYIIYTVLRRLLIFF